MGYQINGNATDACEQVAATIPGLVKDDIVIRDMVKAKGMRAIDGRCVWQFLERENFCRAHARARGHMCVRHLRESNRHHP